jgi:hypothetical protein
VVRRQAKISLSGHRILVGLTQPFSITEYKAIPDMPTPPHSRKLVNANVNSVIPTLTIKQFRKVPYEIDQNPTLTWKARNTFLNFPRSPNIQDRVQ